jgi:cytochrome P450
MTTDTAIPDLFSATALADPHPTYAELRRLGVVHDERNRMWVVTRHADVLDALHRPDELSSAAGYGAFAGAEVGPRADNERPGRGIGLDRAFGSRVLIASDPPEHTMLRRIVSRGFTKRAMTDWETRATRLADDLVERLADRLAVAGEADFTRDVAIPFPVTLIAEILGIPAERMAEFRRWSEALVGALANAVDIEQNGQDIADMATYFSGVVEQRRSEPGDDLISVIAAATPDGEQLSSFEVVMFCILLLVAGNETTTNLLGNMLHAFWDHPDQWARLLDDPGLAGAAVEEGLRYCGPVQGLFRQTTAPVVLGGVELPAGANVYVSFAAANRDGSVFDEPDRFLLDRDAGAQVAFGHGIHFCLGAQLARMEARLALTALACRGLTLRPAEPAIPTASAILRGFRSIPVRS